MVAPDQLAAAHAEQFDPRFALVVGERDDVRVLIAVRDDLLVLRDRLDGAELIAEDRSALELERLGRAFHVDAQLHLHALGVAFQEAQHLAYHLAVAAGVHHPDTRSDTAMDVVLEAGALVVAGDGLGAGAVGEEFLEQVHRLADGAGAGERAEVACAVGEHPSGEIDLRELLGEVYLDVGIGLVVLEPGVVEGFVLLDEQVLQQQRLLDGLGDDEFEVRDMADHRLDTQLLAVRGLKVGAHAVAEARGLADVQDPSAGGLHQVDAGLCGQGAEAVRELRRARFCSDAGGHAPSVPRARFTFSEACNGLIRERMCSDCSGDVTLLQPIDYRKTNRLIS